MIGGAGYLAGSGMARRSAQEAQQEARLEDLEAQQASAYAPPPPAPPMAPAAPTPPAAAEPDLVSSLQELKTLKDEGVLTAEEFEAAKQKLLAS